MFYLHICHVKQGSWKYFLFSNKVNLRSPAEVNVCHGAACCFLRLSNLFPVSLSWSCWADASAPGLPLGRLSPWFLPSHTCSTFGNQLLGISRLEIAAVLCQIVVIIMVNITSLLLPVCNHQSIVIPSLLALQNTLVIHVPPPWLHSRMTQVRLRDWKEATGLL